jgi:hypothetical protein
MTCYLLLKALLRITEDIALEETGNPAQTHLPPKPAFNLTTAIFKSDILISEEEYDDLNDANDTGNREAKEECCAAEQAVGSNPDRFRSCQARFGSEEAYRRSR